jgi:Zn-dependent peptidase ImmA (M78 family)
MSQPVTGIQPNLLRWARESHGFSIGAVADKLKRDPTEIMAWERGESAPTYPQLEKLAYEIYHRPLAVFFFPAPPNEPNPQQAFRSLHNTNLEHLEPDTRYKIRLAMALQGSLKELHNHQNPNPQPIFRDVRLNLDKSIPEQAKLVRTALSASLEIQLRWKDAEAALKAWRDMIENTGIYVFKNTFKQKSISGFCLLDEELPIIYLNNSTTKTRQIFSLLHELIHILLQTSTISRIEIPEQNDEHSRIERFCNALAAEILMPSNDFAKQIQNTQEFDDPFIQQLARRYGVSREAILRKLLDQEKVSADHYNQKASAWKAQQKPNTDGGGKYHTTQASYLGERYLTMVLSKYNNGMISLEQTAAYLGVKAKSIAGFEDIIARKGIPA